jgi:hypothetical protein
MFPECPHKYDADAELVVSQRYSYTEHCKQGRRSSIGDELPRLNAIFRKR